MVRSLGYLAIALVLAIPAGAQSRQSGYTYSQWQETPYTGLEWRSRCEGGPTGVEDGPIKWTVQYRNRSKTDTVSFSYLIKAPGEGKQPAATSRKTILPKEMVGTMVVLNTHRCDDGIEGLISRVRYGIDADSVPYAVPRPARQ